MLFCFFYSEALNWVSVRNRSQTHVPCLQGSLKYGKGRYLFWHICQRQERWSPAHSVFSFRSEIHSIASVAAIRLHWYSFFGHFNNTWNNFFAVAALGGCWQIPDAERSGSMKRFQTEKSEILCTSSSLIGGQTGEGLTMRRFPPVPLYLQRQVSWFLRKSKQGRRKPGYLLLKKWVFG